MRGVLDSNGTQGERITVAAARVGRVVVREDRRDKAVMIARGHRADRPVQRPARRFVAAEMLGQERGDQRVFHAATDDGAERFHQTGNPRRLSGTLAVAGLDQCWNARCVVDGDDERLLGLYHVALNATRNAPHRGRRQRALALEDRRTR